MAHFRSRPTTGVKLSEISVDPNMVIDHRFVELYCRLEKGEIKAALTRLPLAAISSGFYERQADKTVHFSRAEPKHVCLFRQIIRSGSRPTLHIYWSPLAPEGGGFVCADDEVALAAYSDLNFTLVPCLILRPQKALLAESSIWVEKREGKIALAKAVARTPDKYESIIGDTLPSFSDVTGLLITRCENTRAAILAFHENGLSSDVHYHQMLHAVLRRHERILDSIRRLVVLGRSEHAFVLIRVAYEAFLNFYVDWLSPEFFGPRLQLLSAIRAVKIQEGRMRKGDPNIDLLMNFVRFLENTSEKARVSPLGMHFHRSVYPQLSLIAHQSYIYLQNEASEFLGGDTVESQSLEKSAGRLLDVLTTALLVRISNDIGICAN